MQYFEMRWFFGKRPLETGGNILEIGCGRGAGARFILDKIGPARLVLADIDLLMLKKARRYLQSGDPRGTASACQADATFLPFEDRVFDAVFGFGFLHHVPQWRRSLSDVVRVLKMGAPYYFVEFYPELYQNAVTKHLLAHPQHDRFRSRDLKDAFKAAKLSLEHSLEMKKVGIIGIAVPQPEDERR
jgi:ubiquinone/menaquinone biosynthesis C-methylase UbiE